MTAPDPATPDPAPQDPPAQGDPKPEAQQPAKPETDWRAEAKKWETRAKENKTAADRLAELEESKKDETQKAVARAEAAEKRAADLEAADQKRQADAETAKQIADWKMKIAEDTGVPASALRGSTKEDLQEHARELKALLPDPNTRRVGGAYVPAEGRNVGAGGNDPAAEFGRLIQNARRNAQ